MLEVLNEEGFSARMNMSRFRERMFHNSSTCGQARRPADPCIDSANLGHLLHPAWFFDRGPHCQALWQASDPEQRFGILGNNSVNSLRNIAEFRLSANLP